MESLIIIMIEWEYKLFLFHYCGHSFAKDFNLKLETKKVIVLKMPTLKRAHTALVEHA